MIYTNATIMSREIITRTGIFRKSFKRRWWFFAYKPITEEQVLTEYHCIAPGGLPVINYEWEWVRV